MIPLKDICHNITDGKHGDCQDEVNSGFYFISCKNVKEGWIDYSNARNITKNDFLDTHRRTQLQPNDIVITNSGTIGRMALVTDSQETTRTTFQKSVAILKPNKEKVSPKWLYYNLIGKKDELIAWAGGTAQKNLLLRDLRAFNVSLPPLPTQRKIAAILSTYDDLIENNTRRIKILEEMAQAIYREWFVHFRFPGHEGVRKVESELGLIPEGWEVARLGDVCKLTMGQSPKSEFYNNTGEGLPFHQGVTNFGFRFPVDEIYCTVKNRIAEPGDILFSVRAPVGRINLADKKIVIGRGLSAIRHKNGHQLFTYYQLKERFKEEDTMGGGTIFKAVTKDDMINIKMLFPSYSLLKLFTDKVEPLSSQLENLLKRNRILHRTRDLLLPKLISGEIDASELDIKIYKAEA